MNFILDHYESFISAALSCLSIIIISLFIGLLLAFMISFILISKQINKIYKIPIIIFSYILRTTPLLIQLYFIYYVLGLWIYQNTSHNESINNLLANNAFWAIVAFSLNTSAYTCEIIKHAALNVNQNEILAGLSFGLSNWQIRKKIIIPHILKSIIPAYSNEVLAMLHSSAILSTIAITDLTQIAKIIANQSYEYYPAFITVAIIYLFINSLFLLIFKLLEAKFNNEYVFNR